MLEEAYHVEATAALTLLGRLWFEKIAYQLWNYAESLNDWLHELSKHPSPDWRERLEAFIAEQEAAGFILSPESHATLVAYLENWASMNLSPPPHIEQRTTEANIKRPSHPQAVQLSATKAPSLLPPRKAVGPPASDLKPSWWWPFADKRREFYSYLTNARGCIHDLEPLLESLATRIDAAKPDEACDVDAELNAIEYLIWRHNDLMESARDTWLSGNLGSEEFIQLDLALTPASLGLPLFTDREQANRARTQAKAIGARLKQEIAFFDRVIFALEKIETAGEVASLVLAGGILIAAAKQGGKVVLVKTVGKMLASAAAASVVGEVTNAALNAAGVEDETIEKVQNAVELVSWLLFLKKARLLGNSARANAKPKMTDDDGVVDGGTRQKVITPYRDPERPEYNSGATHIDHAHARSLGGGDAPSNLRPLPAESNLRKGGYEGELKRYKDMLIRSGMSEKDAQAVIQPEIDALRRSVVARPVDPSVLDSLPFNPNDQGR